MRIGIDARELTGHPTGVGRYLSGLLDGWATGLGRGHEFLLYAHRPLETKPWPFAMRVLNGHGGTVWEQLTLARAIRRDGVEAFFSPGYTAPLFSGVPTTVAIHDVSFFAHPEWFSPREGFRRRLLTRRTAHMARMVVTISEFSRGELIRRVGVPSERIRVIPPGISPPGSRPHDGAGTRVLYVGSIFNRRNIPDLITAMDRVIDAHPAAGLDLVGDNRSRPAIDVSALIGATRHAGQIRWHRYVDDGVLRSLYASAGAFAFLSEYEGLGLTPLEAMSAGVPPVLLDTPVARESCGDAALYVRHGDVAGTAAALSTVLSDAATRARLHAAAPAVLARYNHDTAARLTLAAIEGR